MTEERILTENDSEMGNGREEIEEKDQERENEGTLQEDLEDNEENIENYPSCPKIFDVFNKNVNNEYIEIEDPDLSEQSVKLLNTRGYYIKGFDKDGNEFFHEEHFNQFCRRISRCLASAETLYTDDIKRIRMLEFNIYQDIFNKRFTFNSPALFNLGKGFCDNKERIRDHHLIYKKNLLDMQLEDYKYIYNSKTTKQMLFACFVIGIEDNLESIMDGLKDAALVSKAGGGVGFNFGNTRERNALVFGGVCGKASGPVSWIHMYNEMGNSVVQGGTRRAALMGMLYDDHPDIFEFMHCKDEEGVLSKFNISVAVSNTLMDSIINNRPDDHFVFHSRKDGKEVKEIPTGVYKTNSMGEKEMTFMETKDITCGKVWNEICEHAWKRGDPGVFFIDNANYDNILKEDTTGDYIIESTNPCVTGDTLVSTPDGYKHAKDVKVGDYISTLSGPDKVDRIEVNENMPVYKVTMSDGDFVKVTESHKFHAIKKNSENKDYEYISLKDLEVGDYIQTVIDRDIDGKLYIIDTFIKSIEKMDGLHTVYDIHCPNDNWITQGYVSQGCGEQPLPNFTSCNLGSINLNSFLTLSEDKKNLNFNIRELSNQIIRSTYYLDLIIDATSFPVRKIEEKTKNIRPVGLGFMGLTDVAFRCNLSYKSEDFKQLCNLIGSIYASTSLFTTISISKEKIKNKLPEYKLVEKLFKKNGIDEETIEKTKFEDLIKLLKSSDIPPTTLNALFSLSTFFEIYTNRNKFKEYSNYEEFFKDMLKNISIGNIRNSRRLSIAPVGSTSMIMDASNGIEPLFALSWGRKVVANDKTDETTIQFSYIYKYLNDEERKKLSSGEKLEGDKYLCANDLSVDDHVDIVGIFANYIDSAISKCVAEGTIIETNFGNIKIEDFSDNRVKGQFKDISHKGYKVKDQNGKWVNVKSHYCDGRNKCFILFFENNKCIKCSFTHKFLTDDGFKTASELCREFDLDNNTKVLAKDPDNFENNISLKLIHYEISETLLFDIELDSEDHTYLIDDIITHNTCNLKNSATVDDVKYAYEKAYKLGCKGITIYRDGSRNSQPITRTDNKVEMVKEKDGIRLVNTKRERPKFARGITENVDTSNYGTLYVTLNFDENNDPFEVFITLGKSGNEIASLVDACARLISIALRSNTDIKDLIKTLINMDSSNPWFYDSDKNGEIIMTSIPDAIAKLIIEIMDHKDEVLSNSSNIEKNKNDKFDKAAIEMEMLKENSANGGVIECPKCHKMTYSIFSGCRICINPDCGYSACDAI